MIVTLPNFLSLLRGFSAFIFLLDNPYYRAVAIFIAMVTDSLDGFLARRWSLTGSFGAILDPIMDKFFVLFVMSVFLWEGKLQGWEALALLSREVAMFLFGFYLIVKGSWIRFQFRSVWPGKVFTTLQFFVLLALTFGIVVPDYFYGIFVLLGILFFIELNQARKKLSRNKIFCD